MAEEQQLDDLSTQLDTAIDNASKVISAVSESFSGELKKAASTGAVPAPINGPAWLGLHDRLNDAFPDFSFNLRDAQQVGDTAQATLQLNGTHSSDLDLSALDLPNVPTTGKSFELPP